MVKFLNKYVNTEVLEGSSKNGKWWLSEYRLAFVFNNILDNQSRFRLQTYVRY